MSSTASSAERPRWGAAAAWAARPVKTKSARVLASEFAEVDPVNEDAYKANAKAAGKHFSALKSWAKKELTQIPRSDRKLVTAHAAPRAQQHSAID